LVDPINTEDLRTLVLLALAAELDALEKWGLTHEGVARAEWYLAWLRGEA